MSIDLDRLEELAKAATPGPWEWRPRWTAIYSKEDVRIGHYFAVDDARYLAALDPSTVLELIRLARQGQGPHDCEMYACRVCNHWEHKDEP